MKLPIRILLVFLCAALIIAMPFVLSSPDMLSRYTRSTRKPASRSSSASPRGRGL